MADEGFKRKLTAILSADAVGYSRLMEDDEEATVRTLKSYREVLTTLIKQHNGMVIDSPGDNLLADFVSVVDAVQCAVSIQNEINARNENLPENRRMDFRIGINLGDVIQEGERIYGDGVNIAARLEGLATPGGICISKTAFDQIERKLPYGYEYIGDQTVKNISKPVGAYRVMLQPRVTVAGGLEKTAPAPGRRKALLTGMTALLVVAVAVGIWQFYMRRPSVQPASVEKMAYPLPDKPSIAILPFDNLSGDPEKDYIADSISENIITALSYIPELFVIARNSSFTYKGKPVKVQQVSEELGVRYILEGSILMSDEKIRITTQLIDALTGGHIWSERYDRDFNDLLNLLDEITLAIAVALQVELTEGEQARIVTTDNLDAWRYLNKGNGFFVTFSKEGVVKGRELYKKALEIDPDYAGAVTVLAWTHFIDARYGYSDSRKESFKQAVELANKSAALDDNQPFLHDLLSNIYLMQKQHDKAIKEGRKSIALGPNRAMGHRILGEVMYRSGHFEEAVQMLEKGIRLQPHTPTWYLGHMMNAYYWVGRDEESLTMAEQLIDRGRKAKQWMFVWWGNWGAARAHIRLGQEEKARENVATMLKIRPDFGLYGDRKNTLYKPELIEREHADLHKAGMPELAPPQ